MQKILAIEDAPEQALIIQQSLEDDFHSVIMATTLKEAQDALQNHPIDLVLLDVGLPDGDGLQFFANEWQASKYNKIPVIFLTGKSDIAQKIIGFSLGAEDYITKPVHPMELKARVHSRLKRIQTQKERSGLLNLGNLQINTSLHQVHLADGHKLSKIDLTPLEFKLLVFFASHVEQVFTRQQLVEAVHGEKIHISERTIDTHVSNLKRKISGSDHTIKSLYSVGYSLSPVSLEPRSETPDRH